eukprot:TRINITY_DN507_c0_g3_i2.p3 TRINITY_DN507_c0_g3~~TRINITY_DN507_c0_g3_i2.p3  ORF type:complete len:125 (+),score=12.29 TRINITY_DN507_c0_g3_i2:365-739(+)
MATLPTCDGNVGKGHACRMLHVGRLSMGGHRSNDGLHASGQRHFDLVSDVARIGQCHTALLLRLRRASICMHRSHDDLDSSARGQIEDAFISNVALVAHPPANRALWRMAVREVTQIQSLPDSI